MIRQVATRITVACLLVPAAIALATRESAAQLLDVRQSELTASDGTMFDVTTGIVRVPERRAGATDRAQTTQTIDLAVVRVRRKGSPASSKAHVVLAGGPGDSGVNQVLGLASRGGALFADLMNSDVIGIDQRGTGRSTPNLSSQVLYGFPLDQPGSLDAWLPIVERASKGEASRLRAAGIALDAYNTRESADDVEAVCRALNYARVALWGRSYGTHLALATLRRHQTLVERAILVSPEGPDHTWKLPSRVDAVLSRLESRGAGDLIAPLSAIVERLQRAPASVAVVDPQKGPVTILLGPLDVQWVVSEALGDPRALTTLPGAIREMRDGDFRRIAQVALARRQRAGVQSAMKMMMDLSSGASHARRARIEREAQSAVLGNAINFPGMYLREAWGAIDLGEEFRQPVVSAVPVLILAGDLDPRTPIENAHEVAEHLSHATVITIENATHQFDLFGSAVVRAVLSRFLNAEAQASDRIVLPPLTFK